jgi:hypothetical protein
MIETICHCGDVHIMKDSRHDEYRKVFEIFYNKLKDINPDRIVVNGDTWNDFTDIKSEGFILMGEFLNRLSSISKVIITKGNHDFSRKNLKRIDTIKSITTLLDNKNIIYYDKTGFYDDDNIIWVVWDNADRINPWKSYIIEKDVNKTYIDLYHDPIENVKFYNGLVFNKKGGFSVSDLLGDISMLNDIHLHQSFSNGTKAYSSSVIQQDFGEFPYGHGFLKWSVKNKNFEFIELPNDHRFIKFTINPNTNYDKLHLISKHVGKYNKFRLEWNEHAAFITNENENKIKKYLKDKYNAEDIEFKPNRIYTDIKDGKMLSEVIDINNKEVQQNIIKQYLKENKFEDEFIDKIIDIDNIINDRLELSDTRNVIWNIDKFWFNNFKSYGDNNVVEWDKFDGIVQINGFNQQGKTSIIDAICFILYGTTISTTKIEKNGNNRYINKNRDLDYCDGGAIIDVNGEKYTMYRKVEREFKKRREIKAVPMILDYYKGSEMTEDAKQTGEKLSSTQRLLDGVLGNFEDFVRLALTNADNLNALLSMDRSVFIDSIIKDAGYDIFEKKLNEFKEYKKELNLEKINVNAVDLNSKIDKMELEFKDKEDFLFDTINDIKDIEKEIKEKIKEKDELLTNLNNVDEAIVNINIDEIESNIKKIEKLVISIKDEINLRKIDIEGSPKEFDNDNYNKISDQYIIYVSEKNKRDIELVKIQSVYKQNEEKINNVDKNINIEKSKYIDYLRNNIAGLRIESREYINDINNNSNQKRNEFERQKNTLKIDINNLKQLGLAEKENINKYTNMLNGENQICPTCNQLILNKDEEHMNSLILESTKKVEDISKTGKQKIETLNEINSKLEALQIITDKLVEEKIAEYNSKIKVIQDKIDNYNISMIQDRIEEIIQNKERAEKENESLFEKIEERKIYITKLETGIKNLDLNLQKLKMKKSQYDNYIEINNHIQKLSIDLRDYTRNWEDNKKLLSDYSKSEKLIKENKRINTELEKIKSEIDRMSYKKSELLDDKLIYSNDITLSKKVIDDLKDKLNRYIEQEKLEEIHNVYLKLMHRTGLPTYLLTKNIDILNEELNSLLTNINFTLFFDEDLNLKLQHDGLDGVISAVEASGMERVFSSIILKLVLRVINFKSKPDFMLFDEVIDKLTNKSVDKFIELLDVIKTRINKIILIEHRVEINSELLIQVNKDVNGISSFELI